MSSAPFPQSVVANVRHRHQLTYRSMASLTGIPKSSLCDIEKGKRRLAEAEWREVISLLTPLAERDDQVEGLSCYRPDPKAERELVTRLIDALNESARTVIVYPTLHPWLSVSRIVRESLSHHDLPRVDRVVEEALEESHNLRQLVFPVPQRVIQRMLECEAEFTALPASTVRRQLMYFVNHIIDELGIALPIVDDTAHSLFLAFNAQVRTTVLIDDNALVRVLANGSVQWVDAEASQDASQLVFQVAERVEKLVATAIDLNGSTTLFNAFESRFAKSHREVAR